MIRAPEDRVKKNKDPEGDENTISAGKHLRAMVKKNKDPEGDENIIEFIHYFPPL